jgi:hypothetical protein
MNQGAKRFSDEDIQFWNLHMALMKKIWGKLNPRPINETTSRVLSLLARRVYDGTVSLGALWKDAPHNWSLDGAMVLRGIYEASVQVLYILSDRDRCGERAQQYADFMWLEMRKVRNWAERSETAVAGRLVKNVFETTKPLYADKEFQRVEAQYRTKNGKRWNKWYQGGLCDLAHKVGLRDECEFLQGILSGAVHSSFLTLHGPVVFGRHLLTYAWTFVLRVYGRLLEYHGIPFDEAGLTEHECAVIRESYKPVLS